MSNQNEGLTTYDVTNFTIREVTECGRAVRTMGVGVIKHGGGSKQDREILAPYPHHHRETI